MTDVMEKVEGNSADSQQSGKGFSLPMLTPFQLFNLVVGIIGIQFAWSMQIALSSRVLEPLGANPFLFGLIWCAGPITGLLVQPIVGAISDRTWTKIGRRRPFLIVGAFLGAIALLIFPFSPTLLFAALTIWIIDACVNVSQGPYRALVPDTVNPKQHAIANSYMNAAFGAGSVIALGVAPALKLFNIPMSIEQQYIMSAAALFLFIVYTSLNIREYKKPTDQTSDNSNKKSSFLESFKVFMSSSKEIHKICMVQFMIWVGIMCMFIYLTPFIVHNVYHLPDMSTKEYKNMENLHSIVVASSGNLSGNEEKAASANAKLSEVQNNLTEDKSNPALLNSIIFSISDSENLEKYVTEEVIEELNSDLNKYISLNNELDLILAEASNTEGAVIDKESNKFKELIENNTEIKKLSSRNTEIQSLGSASFDKVTEKFSSLLADSNTIAGIVAGQDLNSYKIGNKYKELSEKYLRLTEAKKSAEIKSLVLQYNVLKNDKNATVDKTTKINFDNIEKFELMKKIETEATNTAQIALVAFNGVALLLSIPLGYFCGKIGKKAVFSGSLSFLAIAFLFAPAVSTPLQAIVMMACAGVAWATILSIPFAFLCDYMPKGNEGSIMGIFNMFIAGPQLISATLIGWIISQNPMNTVFGVSHDWAIAFVIAAVCTFVAIIGVQFLNEKREGACELNAAASGGH